MQFKPVPEPPADLEAVAPILAAVPETAGAVDDCCRHLLAETRLEARDEAETWLTFLRALELVTAESDGYRRRESASVSDSQNVPPADLRRAFRERVYGADPVLDVLGRAEQPVSGDDVFDSVRDEIPAFQRDSRPGRLEAARNERVRRLLEWAVLLGLSERTDDGRYRSATPGERPG